MERSRLGGGPTELGALPIPRLGNVAEASDIRKSRPLRTYPRSPTVSLVPREETSPRRLSGSVCRAPHLSGARDWPASRARRPAEPVTAEPITANRRAL